MRKLLRIEDRIILFNYFYVIYVIYLLFTVSVDDLFVDLM